MTPVGHRVDLAANAGAGNGAAKIWPGGKALLTAEGTWGGGNIKLQMTTANGTWVDVPSSTLSANGALTLDLPQCQVRSVITTSTAVYAYLTRLK